MKSMKLIAGMLLLSAAFLTGCTETALMDNQKKLPNGDLQETTASLTEIPSFLKTTTASIKTAYDVASQNLDILQQIPCYCGCKEDGHKNNAQCFINRTESDGRIVWDDHGKRCETCMTIAVTAADLKKQGKTPLEIRKAIDDKYSKAFHKPTDTPMPHH